MNHRELTKAVHDNAVAKLFWQEPDFDRFLMLIVSEAGEMINSDRKSKRFSDRISNPGFRSGHRCKYRRWKHESRQLRCYR